MDGREPRSHPRVPTNRLAASHGKKAWYKSAVFEAQSTPSSPQFFIPSLESISGPVKCLLQLSNQVTAGFSILFWEFNVEIPVAVSAEKGATNVHRHQLESLQVCHHRQADLESCRVEWWSASKEVVARVSGRKLLCNKPASHLVTFLRFHPSGSNEHLFVFALA